MNQASKSLQGKKLRVVIPLLERNDACNFATSFSKLNEVSCDFRTKSSISDSLVLKQKLATLVALRARIKGELCTCLGIKALSFFINREKYVTHR